MKKSHLIWILLLSLVLALSGCGGKEAAKEEPVQETAVEQVTEPELPEEEVKEAGSDVTQQAVSPETTPEEEPVAEQPVEDPAQETETTTATETEEPAAESNQTAQNYRVVSLKDLKAYPEEMHVKVGTTVEWRNVNDNLQHIIGWSGQKAAGIKPEPMLQGESWSYTFTKPAKIAWFSTARPTIQGVIYVEE